MLELATARAASEELESCWQSSGPFRMQADSFGWGAMWAAVGALVTGLFAYIVQKSRGGTDIEVAVLAEWQKLNAALSDRLAAVEAQFADYRTKMAGEIEALHKSHRAEMRALRAQNDGLQRIILQNSQSSAQLISESPVTHPKDDDDAE